MIVSCFSNYFATNRTCDLHVTDVYFKHISTETIVTPIVLDFSYFNCNWMWLQTTHHGQYGTYKSNPNL